MYIPLVLYSATWKAFKQLVVTRYVNFLRNTSSSVNARLTRTSQSNPFCWLFPKKLKQRCAGVTHLEEVILMDHAAVGQRLDEPVGEGGFPSIGYTAWNIARQEVSCEYSWKSDRAKTTFILSVESVWWKHNIYHVTSLLVGIETHLHATSVWWTSI